MISTNTDDYIFNIHESRLSTLQSRITNLNKKMSGNGQIVYSILGKTQDKYTDASGQEQTGTYYQVNVDGAVKFRGMECIGKISFANKNSDDSFHKQYKVDLSEQDRAFLIQPHDRSCACCNRTNNNRMDLYAFRCNEDTMGPNGVEFKAGQYYQVGTSCVDEFIGKEARSAIDDLIGQMNEQERIRTGSKKPKFYDAELLTKYALVVGKLRIDEAYNYYKNNPGDIAALGTEYNIPRTYRCCKPSVSKSYGYQDGTIMKTAKMLYCLNELDPNVYNYDDMFDAPDCKSDIKESITENKAVLKSICDKYGFSEAFESEELNNIRNNVFSLNSFKQISNRLDNSECMIAANKNAAIHCDMIRDDYCQILVDLCDDYLYKSIPRTKTTKEITDKARKMHIVEKSMWMHEQEKPLFKPRKSISGDIYYVDDSGWKIGKSCAHNYDALSNRVMLNGYSFKGSDRILKMQEKWNIIPDELVPVRIFDTKVDKSKNTADLQLLADKRKKAREEGMKAYTELMDKIRQSYESPCADKIEEAYKDANTEASKQREMMSNVSEKVAQPSDNNKDIDNYPYHIKTIPSSCIRSFEGKSGEKWCNVSLAVPESISDNKWATFVVKQSQIKPYSTPVGRDLNAVVCDSNYSIRCQIKKNGAHTSQYITIDKLEKNHQLAMKEFYKNIKKKSDTKIREDAAEGIDFEDNMSKTRDDIGA